MLKCAWYLYLILMLFQPRRHLTTPRSQNGTCVSMKNLESIISDNHSTSMLTNQERAAYTAPLPYPLRKVWRQILYDHSLFFRTSNVRHECWFWFCSFCVQHFMKCSLILLEIEEYLYYFLLQSSNLGLLSLYSCKWQWSVLFTFCK